jgi:raffinose/stachyose/melibiose transport system permease protein
VALYALVAVAPALASVGYSLFSGGISGERSFVGLDNYATLLSDRIFWLALFHNLLLAVASAVIQLPIALGFALAFSSTSQFSKWLRALVFSPMVLPSAVVAIIFMLLYNPMEGPLTMAFEAMTGTAPAWLSDKLLVLPALIAAISWRYIGFHMVILLAGVQAVDRTLYEAAALDGAGLWGRFRHVTLPSIAPALKLSLLLAALGSLKYFDLVYIMTGGGPDSSSELLSTYLFKLGVFERRFGYSSAVATALLVLSLGIGLAIVLVRSRRERE